MADRHFTAEEANALLDRVRPLAERMVEHRRSLAEAEERHADLLARIVGNGGDFGSSELAERTGDVAREAAAVMRCVEHIHAIGAQVKDLDQGLVDFPALREGEEVLLCWHVGEDEVGYWHTSAEGFAGRKPLPL